jgi:HK97 family phage major capsid protein
MSAKARTGVPSSSSLPRPRVHSWYSWKASANGIELFIYDEIGAYGVTAKDFIADLQRIGQQEPFTLRIHSPGGDFFDAIAIAEAIKRHKGSVTSCIDGLCASAATVVALAGESVSMSESGMFMIHDVWCAVVGNADDMRSNAETLDKLNDALISTYQAKTGLPPERIAQMMSDETWLSAEEAQQLGFVDEITEPLKAAASIRDFDLTKFRNAPLNQISNKGTHMNTPPTQTEIEAKADELYKAKLSRDKEIDAISAAVLKRDKKDFSALAAKFKEADKSADEFARAIATSNEFRSAGNVIGAGAEELLPGQNGDSPGSLVVAHLREFVNKNNGLFPEKSRLIIPIPDRSFLPRAAATVTTRSLDFGIDQQPGLVPLPQQRLYVADLLTTAVTNGSSVRYLYETSFTPAATTVDEGAPKPEQAINVDKKDATVRKIAAWTKIGDESIADFPQIQMLVNMRLPFAVSFREEAQLLNGDGIGTNLVGIMHTAGLLAQPRGADTRLDAIFKAITQIRSTAFLEPDGIVIHPADFETLRLAKDANNQYYGGGPFTGAYGNDVAQTTGMPPRNYATVWGLPCAITNAMTQGTLLVGAFRIGATIWRRTGMTIEVTNSDQDDFIRDLVTIRAEERLTLSVYFANAFCQVTGLT